MTTNRRRPPHGARPSAPPVPSPLAGKRCKATRRDGTPCQAAALADGFCAFHSPKKAAAFRRGRAAGGRERMRPRAVTPPETPPADLSDTAAVVRYLGVLVNRCERGLLDVKIANAVTGLVNLLLRGLSQTEMLARFARIEAAVAALPAEQAADVRDELAAVRAASETRQ